MTVVAIHRHNLAIPGIFFVLSFIIHSWLLIKLPDLNSLGELQKNFKNIQIEIVPITPAKVASIENNVRTVKNFSQRTAAKQPKKHTQISSQANSEIPANQKKKPEITETAETRIDKNGISQADQHVLTDNLSLATRSQRNKKINYAEQNAYLQALFRKIEQKKYYPGIARRRGMEDLVNISFYVLADGKISDVEVQSKYKSLRQSALTAIREALPFPPLPESMKSPLKIQYAMAFKLQ